MILFILQVKAIDLNVCLNNHRQPRPFNYSYYLRRKAVDEPHFFLYQAQDRQERPVLLKEMRQEIRWFQFCLEEQLSHVMQIEPMIDFYKERDENTTIKVYKALGGQQLRLVLESGGLEILQIEFIMFKALTLLDRLHSFGVYHNNINLKTLIFRAQPTRALYLSDFYFSGLNTVDFAHKINPNVAQEALRQGKPWTGTDIYCLGQVLRQLLKHKMVQELKKNPQSEQVGRKQFNEWKELIGGMMQKNSSKRISAREGLRHRVFRRILSVRHLRDFQIW